MKAFFLIHWLIKLIIYLGPVWFQSCYDGRQWNPWKPARSNKGLHSVHMLLHMYILSLKCGKKIAKWQKFALTIFTDDCEGTLNFPVCRLCVEL